MYDVCHIYLCVPIGVFCIPTSKLNQAKYVYLDFHLSYQKYLIISCILLNLKCKVAASNMWCLKPWKVKVEVENLRCVHFDNSLLLSIIIIAVYTCYIKIIVGAPKKQEVVYHSKLRHTLLSFPTIDFFTFYSCFTKLQYFGELQSLVV